MKASSQAVTTTSPRTNCTLSSSMNPAGCGVTNAAGTFGDEFNANGGGVWALQLESDGIKVFFFPRAEIPEDLTYGHPDPTLWGDAVMDFVPGSCKIEQAWSVLKIVSPL